MLFVQFMMQLVYFFFGFFEGAFSCGRDLVEPPASALHTVEGRAQQARSFQSVQKGIERARADAVAVVGELLHHGESEDRFVRGVQQHVDPDKPVEEFALLICHKNKYTAASMSRP
jgi:hypothetical protein